MKKLYLLPVYILLLLKTFAQSELNTTTLFDLQFLKVINTGYHEGAPVISPDRKTLYFFVINHPRNRFGDKDPQDIWFSKKGKNGKWKSLFMEAMY